MKRTLMFSRALLVIALLPLLLLSTSSFQPNEKEKIGFLVHDLVSERWKKDMDFFANKIEELGYVPVTKNAFGDPHTQVKQGKAMIDDGVKVIAVVPEDGKVLAELVQYAGEKGAKIIAYDRMILNCNLDYYISFNSVKVGEMMAEYAISKKPRGKYAIINGPSSDNNAILVRQGLMNKLKPHIESGAIEIVLDKEAEAWYALNALFIMDGFLSDYTGELDVVLAASDGLSMGVIDALGNAERKGVVVTGQDASLEACKQIVLGNQTMTIYKSIRKIANEAAELAVKIAKGESVTAGSTVNNGQKEVPSILFDPVVVDKSNLHKTVIADGHIKESDL